MALAYNKEAADDWKTKHGQETHLQFFSPDPNFVMSERIQHKFERVSMRRQFSPQNIYLSGEAGTGKTSLALQYAALSGSPTYKAPCPAMKEVGQWMGRMAYSPDKGTYYISSLFAEAVETPYSVVILNDITRVENPKVLNPLMDLLDDTRETEVMELDRRLSVAPGVVFIATANEGWEYTGADDPDKALKNRFEILYIPLPPADILRDIVHTKVGESQAINEGISYFLECLQKGIKLSVRHILRLAEDIRYGASLLDAAMLGMLGDITDEQRVQALQLLQIRTGITTEGIEDKWVPWLNIDTGWQGASDHITNRSQWEPYKRTEAEATDSVRW